MVRRFALYPIYPAPASGPIFGPCFAVQPAIFEMSRPCSISGILKGYPTPQQTGEENRFLIAILGPSRSQCVFFQGFARREIYENVLCAEEAEPDL